MEAFLGLQVKINFNSLFNAFNSFLCFSGSSLVFIALSRQFGSFQKKKKKTAHEPGRRKSPRAHTL